MWQQEFLDELNDYVGFTPEHTTLLAELGPYLAPEFGRIVDHFYDAIQRTPRAMAVFTGGTSQIERQKGFLRGWLDGLFGGVYDLDYLERRARIGRTHVRIKLDQRYMFGGMNIVRGGLHAALARSAFDPARHPLAHDAIDKICDLELAIMLQTYSEDYTARMRDKERLAMLGQLAGFVGHELRNPLAVMETSLHLLKKRLPIGDEHAGRHMKRLTEQVTVSGGIISDLLELARDRPIARLPTDVPAMLTSALAMLPWKDETILHVDVPEGFPNALLDEKQVVHLVSNLVNNAYQALGRTEAKRIIVAARREDDVLLLSVDDNGPGIPEEIRYRLFEPLQTTRPKGLGLGLALCRRIAEKHSGDIRALKGPLGGARFEARFPHSFED